MMLDFLRLLWIYFFLHVFVVYFSLCGQLAINDFFIEIHWVSFPLDHDLRSRKMEIRSLILTFLFDWLNSHII